jgi:hypothetical protein
VGWGWRSGRAERPDEDEKSRGKGARAATAVGRVGQRERWDEDEKRRGKGGGKAESRWSRRRP